MNLIEAIKSGKRYRRKAWEIDDWVSQDREYLPARLNVEDVKSDDWEIESQPVTITRADFDAAWRRALDVSENMQITTQHYLYELVVRELGL
jgi:uncharacterized lipoprotein